MVIFDLDHHLIIFLFFLHLHALGHELIELAQDVHILIKILIGPKGREQHRLGHN